MDGILCHCPAGADPGGHQLGSLPDCEAPTIKRGTYSRPEVGSIHAYGAHVRLEKLDARGTCPDCGKPRVRVKPHEVRTTDRPDLHDLMPGVVVAIRPALAAHKTLDGLPCSGAGKVPAETRYRSVALEKMIRDFGEESVA